MGEAIKEVIKSEVKLPIWVFGLLLTILMALFAFNATFASTRKQTDVNTKNIEVLQKDKLDRNEFNLVINKLNKIEDLLLDHMQEKQRK